MASFLAACAALFGLRNAPSVVAKLIGAAEAHSAALGTGLEEVDRIQIAPHINAARDALAPAAWDAAYTAGQAMSLDEAVAYALAQMADDP